MTIRPKDLKGKEADLRHHRQGGEGSAGETKADDDFAKSLGLESWTAQGPDARPARAGNCRPDPHPDEARAA
jgi:hypothetical protein